MEPEVETIAVELGRVAQVLLPIGVAVVDQLPQPLLLCEPVWYAGGPRTMEEPPLAVMVAVALAEAEDRTEDGTEEEPEEPEQELSATTEN